MEKKLVGRRYFENPIYKDRAKVLKTSEETGGSYSLGELEVFPGGGNFMHVHSAFEETFTAIEGKLGVMLAGKKYYLQPGESVTVPLYTPHHFFNDGNEVVKCQIKFVPGHDDFIRGIAIAYGLAMDGQTDSEGKPKKLSHLALLMDMTDTRPTGLIGMLFPLFKWMAKKARKNGTQKALLEKYYYE